MFGVVAALVVTGVAAAVAGRPAEPVALIAAATVFGHAVTGRDARAARGTQ
jgi:hypothetical protein